jgi:hypothetical protein
VTTRSPYSECLERVRSVLVFFATTGRANAAVLAELQSEVRETLAAARVALLPIEEVQADLERVASFTLPEFAAGTASRMMRGWIVMASDPTGVDATPAGLGEPDQPHSDFR